MAPGSMRGWRLATAAVSLATAHIAHPAGTLDPAFVNGERPGLVALRYPTLAVSPDGRIALAATQWTGSFGQFQSGQVAMFDGTGQALQAFGTAGVARLPLTSGYSNHSADAIAFDALGRVLVSGARLASSPGAFTVRMRSDGQASATYDNGAPGNATATQLGSAFAFAIDGQSRIVVGGGTSIAGGGWSGAGQDPQPAVARLTGDGHVDSSFGGGGQAVLGTSGVVRAIALDARGGIVLAIGTALVPAIETKTLMRLDDTGAHDAQFGNGGKIVIPDAIVALGDAAGRMLVIAERGDSPPSTRLYRYADGRLDAAFGTGGEVLLPRQYNTLATAPDGAIYAGIVGTTNQTATMRVLRVRSNGTIDTGYGTQGEAAASFDFGAGGGSGTPALAVDAQGRLLAAAIRYNGTQPFGIQGTNVMLYRFTSDAPQAATTSPAIEFRHAAFDHYFVTADADEIAKLDADPASGWARTGESFTVQSRAQGSAMPVCRFWSGATFAPQSSHFYTAYPAECDAVYAGPAWAFEKIAFLLALPVGAGQGNGTCPAGTVPLYRTYNAMKGGAPNHRYTTRAATLDAMIAQGWIMEGEANTRVFACVPS